MEIAKKYFISKILVLFALTIVLPALGKEANEQEFSFGEEFRHGQGIKGSKLYLSDFNLLNTASLAKEGIKIGPNTANNHFDLQEGNILFAPDKPIVVETQE